MKPSKPDAFVRAVEKVASDGISGGAWAVTIEEAEQLLHRHHAKIERLVRRMQKPYLHTDDPAQAHVRAARVDMCAEIYEALKEMRR